VVACRDGRFCGDRHADGRAKLGMVPGSCYMEVMDIAAETQTPTVEWAPVARTMMEQLTEAEQAEVRSSVDQAARRFDPSRVRQVTPTRQGQRPFFVMRATPTLRVFFMRADDRLRVLDVVDAEQLAYFRDEAAPAAH
jgi:hypothetical protein